MRSRSYFNFWLCHVAFCYDVIPNTRMKYFWTRTHARYFPLFVCCRIIAIFCHIMWLLLAHGMLIFFSPMASHNHLSVAFCHIVVFRHVMVFPHALTAFLRSEFTWTARAALIIICFIMSSRSICWLHSGASSCFITCCYFWMRGEHYLNSDHALRYFHNWCSAMWSCGITFRATPFFIHANMKQPAKTMSVLISVLLLLK